MRTLLLVFFLFQPQARAGEHAETAPCDALLHIAPNPELEKQRQLHAEFLLLLTFDHPMLRDVVERTQTTDGLYQIFHLVAGANIPPENHSPLAGKAFLQFQHRPKTVTPRWSWLRLRSKPLEPSKLKHKFSGLRSPEAYTTLTPQLKNDAANEIIDSTAAIFSQLGNKKNWMGDYFDGLQPPIAQWNIADRFYATKTFKANELENLGEIGSASQFGHGLVQFIANFLPDFIAARDEALASAESMPTLAQMKEALLKPTPAKLLLRQQILKFAKGEPLDLPVYSRTALPPPKGLAAFLPSLSPPTALDLTRARETLAALPEPAAVDDSSNAKLNRYLQPARDSSIALTSLTSQIPATPSPTELENWWKAASSRESLHIAVQDHVRELQIQATRDLEKLEEIAEWVAKLVAGSLPIIKELHAHLSRETNNDENWFRRSLLDECGTIEVTLLQTLALTQQRLESQMKWIQLINQISPLILVQSQQNREQIDQLLLTTHRLSPPTKFE